MKTLRSSGYLKKPVLFLLLSLMTLFILSGNALALTNGKIDACNDCHGTYAPNDYRPLDGAYRNITTGAFVGNHRTHMPATATATSCVPCHNNSLYTVDHRNGKIKFNANINTSPATGKYMKYGFQAFTSSQVTNPTLGTCATVNCHFETVTPTWGSSAAATSCDTCHAVKTSPLSHATHESKYACITCHPARLTFDHATSAGNAGRNIAITVSNYVGSNYNYLPSQSGTRVLGTCSTNYCHSSGQSATGSSATPVYAPTAPTWGGTAVCGSCHATTTFATGSHTRHLAVNTNCGNCHTGATAGAYASTNHVNNLIDVAAGLTYSSPGTPGNGYGNCTTAYCHSNGKSSYQSVAWGAASLNCTSCHPTLGGAHARHAGGLNIATLPFYQYTTNKSAGTDVATAASYAFGCANCHPIDPYLHANGSIEVQLNNIAGVSTLRSMNSSPVIAGSGNTTTCASVYCHSNGKGGQTTTMQWGQTYAAAAVDRCAQCHGNSPTTTGAHAAHVVGIHADDIFNGTSGKLPAGPGGAVSVSHGDPLQATTLNCDICHATTVTNSRNYKSSTCSTVGCHPTGTSTDAPLLNIANHVNGSVLVSFKAVQFISKAQLRPGSFVSYTGGVAGWKRNQVATVDQYKNGPAAFDKAKNPLTIINWNNITKSCSNVVCHNMKSGQSVLWTDSLTCDSCHTSL